MRESRIALRGWREKASSLRPLSRSCAASVHLSCNFTLSAVYEGARTTDVAGWEKRDNRPCTGIVRVRPNAQRPRINTANLSSSGDGLRRYERGCSIFIKTSHVILIARLSLHERRGFGEDVLAHEVWHYEPCEQP